MSKFCYNTEMKRALARHDADEARVIPIILRPTDWKNLPFAKLKALPTDGKAVTLWRTRDEAFVDIVRGIKRSIRDLEQRRPQPKGADPYSSQQFDVQEEIPTIILPELPPPDAASN